MNFKKEEAQAKVGKKIRTRIEFSGVPLGATGTVVRADAMGPSRIQNKTEEVWDVVIEWDVPDRPFEAHQRPLQDWFSRDEYERYLEEI